MSESTIHIPCTHAQKGLLIKASRDCSEKLGEWLMQAAEFRRAVGEKRFLELLEQHKGPSNGGN